MRSSTFLSGRFWKGLLMVGAVSVPLLLTGHPASAAIALSSLSPHYFQDFNSLAISGTSNVLPSGWYMAEEGSNQNSSYTAGTGSSTTGDTYSFGSAGSNDRALGGLNSGSLTPQFGVQFLIEGPDVLKDLQIAYTGEQWRLGRVDREDRLDFQYSIDATSLITGNWLDFDALDFIAPVSSGAVGALDGNNPANRRFLSGTLSGLNLAAGTALWLRWRDLDAFGADDGLAIDDFSVTGIFAPAGVPEPGSCLIAGTLFAFGIAGRRRNRRLPAASGPACS